MSKKQNFNIKKPRVVHFRDKCIGCGNCVQESPENWDISMQDGQAVLQGGVENSSGIFMKSLLPEEIEDNLRAQANCPVKIIRVEK